MGKVKRSIRSFRFLLLIVLLPSALFVFPASILASDSVQGEDIYTYGFESGWSGWYADNGLWEVGMPGAPGPVSVHSGDNCAGTVLTANYPNTSSRLISPSIQLPDLDAGEELQLWFWHWKRIAAHDRGWIQISYEESPGMWSAWETIGDGRSGASEVWSLSMEDLSAYADKKVKIAFYLLQGHYSHVDAGWYVDDVYIKGPCIDNDDDGYGYFISDDCPFLEVDCNDADPEVSPGHEEVPGNGIDDNCNGRIDERDAAMPWLQLLLLDD